MGDEAKGFKQIITKQKMKIFVDLSHVTLDKKILWETNWKINPFMLGTPKNGILQPPSHLFPIKQMNHQTIKITVIFLKRNDM